MWQRKRHSLMIKKYLLERSSWIALFICLNLLFLFIAFIDPAIPFTAILYVVFLSVLIFTVFLIVRYHQETSFYKQMKNIEDMYDLDDIHHVDRPFEKMMYQILKKQTEHYKKEVGHYKFEREQEKDELLSWIHEVKTPLTTMKLMIDRIDDRRLKEQLMVEWLRIDLLLDQHLHQKRIQFIEKDVHIEKVALKPLIHNEVKNLQAWCMRKGIGVEVILENEAVLTDEKWLGFMIRQLLTNAIKYSEQSDIVVKSTSIDNRPVLEVIDHGRGIDPKDLPRIFDKGFTSTVDHRNTAATGMGLYLVQKVSESLLIQLEVKSVRHTGTIFKLSFPKKNEFVSLASM